MRAFVLLMALVVFGCGSPTEPVRPPVILISLDTLRSDWLPAYGSKRVETPAIDAFAADSLIFERAFAEVPLTLPSHLSLFTGELPPRHGVRDNVGFSFDPSATPMLQTRLRQQGYATMGVISAQVLGRRTGFAIDFDRWDEPGDGGDAGNAITAERSGTAAVAKVRQWLATPPASPWFLFVHFYEPHMPYRPPEPYLGRYGATYGGEIAAVDALVGQLLDQLRAGGVYDQALVILFSDHGEGLGDHGEDEHGLLLYRESLQVPLMVKLPGQARAGERVARNVGLIDVAPTVLEVVGAPAPAGKPGISLLATEVPADRELYAETMFPMLHFGWSDLAAAIGGDLYLIDGPQPELYDLGRDPAQRRDLLASPDAELDRRGLAALREYLGGIDRSIEAPEQVAAETIATLGALGYIGQPSLPEDRSNLANPMEKAPLVRPLLLGIRLFHEGDFAGSVAALKQAVEVPELAPHAWQFLGSSYDALGQREQAQAAYARGAALPGASSELAETAVMRLLESGDADAALAMIAREAARFPTSAMLAVLASRAHLQRGELDRAADRAQQGVLLGPEVGDAYYQRAVVALARQDAAAALPDLLRAAEIDPRHIGARKALAMLRYSAGDTLEAKRLLEEVLVIAPNDPDAAADLVTIEAELRQAPG